MWPDTQRVGFPKRSWKMFAFAWPEVGHPIINIVSGVPPNTNFLVPPNPYAAGRADQPLPGSLHITSGVQQQPDASTGGPAQSA
ncbi:hypothetical protein MBOT_32620 [Mycobacterium botniense]|uniref:Uncharacterized protein n=1 Tax=Mycobacterium botniense TaxID=84962 RepID=A0A7I9Y1P4_9MYCO|nr:hypothetical protein MBOT_32620 [Mycobacterium botniense]